MNNIIPFQAPATLTSVRKLRADTTQLVISDHGLLQCTVTGDEQTYRGVTAVLLFPISQPNNWVSLRYTDEADKDKEIGVIEDLSEFTDATQSLVRSSLGKHYHEHHVLEVKSIKQKFGQLFFVVRTARSDVEFVTPWRQDRAEDWGNHGKVLLDALNNRYLIPDVNNLSAKEQRLLRTYIYW